MKRLPRYVEVHRPFRDDGELRAFLCRFPDVEVLDLANCDLADHQLDELHGLSGLEALRLDDNLLEEEAVERLWSAPFSLRELSLRGNEIGNAGWSAIASSPRARSLESLDLADSWYEAVSIADFSGSPFFDKLRSLDWSGLWEGAFDGQAAALNQADWMRAIQRLGLNRASVRGATLLNLVETPLFQGLTALSLRECEISWFDAVTLGEPTLAQTLIELDLRGNDLGVTHVDQCWSWLSAMPQLRCFQFGGLPDRTSSPLFPEQWTALLADIAPRLRMFGACNLEFVDDAIAEIARIEWPHLETLDLSGNPLDGDGLQLLAAHIPRLHTLRLARCALEEVKGLEIVASAPLSELDVSGNPLAASLSRLLTPRLRTLGLSAIGLTDAELFELAGSRALGALTSLDISHNAVTSAGIEALIQSKELTSLERIRCSLPPDELYRLQALGEARNVALQPETDRT